MKTRINVYLSEDTHKKGKELAEREGRSFSNWLENTIKNLHRLKAVKKKD